jgi:predicted ATPase
MTARLAAHERVPRIESVRIQNYRALRDLHLMDLQPLTVLLGPNGSGKSTVLDAFAFLSECFNVGLRKAWDRRGRFRELRSRGATGPIVFELRYREREGNPPLIVYHLAIDEDKSGPFVAEEWLRWKRGRFGKPFKFLNFRNGEGEVVTGEAPDVDAVRSQQRLTSRELIAVNTLGQLAEHPRVAALRRFISEWYLSYLSAASTRGSPDAGPQERLSITGDNLANVIQYLQEQHPEQLLRILGTLAQRVPRLESVATDLTTDGRLILSIKDAPFDTPVLAKYASDGTLKLLAYLLVLYDPIPPQLIGIEEPENFLHPRLLPALAEECREAAGRTQLFVTTHSPFFVNRLAPEEVRVLYRDEQGYTQASRASEMPGIREFMEDGAHLGHLWMENYFTVGDPLVGAGGPRRAIVAAHERGQAGG